MPTWTMAGRLKAKAWRLKAKVSSISLRGFYQLCPVSDDVHFRVVDIVFEINDIYGVVAPAFFTDRSHLGAGQRVLLDGFENAYGQVIQFDVRKDLLRRRDGHAQIRVEDVAIGTNEKWRIVSLIAEENLVKDFPRSSFFADIHNFSRASLRTNAVLHYHRQSPKSRTRRGKWRMIGIIIPYNRSRGGGFTAVMSAARCQDRQ